MGGDVSINEFQLQTLLNEIDQEIASLPQASVQLVGAVVAISPRMPHLLSQYILDKLAIRAPMDEVSPAAEAVMRFHAFSQYSDMEFARRDIEHQRTLLHSLEMQGHILVAANFATKLAEIFESCHTTTAEN